MNGNLNEVEGLGVCVSVPARHSIKWTIRNSFLCFWCRNRRTQQWHSFDMVYNELAIKAFSMAYLFIINTKHSAENNYKYKLKIRQRKFQTHFNVYAPITVFDSRDIQCAPWTTVRSTALSKVKLNSRKFMAAAAVRQLMNVSFDFQISHRWPVNAHLHNFFTRKHFATRQKKSLWNFWNVVPQVQAIKYTRARN